MTRAQYKNAIKALGPDIDVPKVLEPDVPKAGLRNVGASQVSYSPRGVESIEAASFAISDQIVASPSILDQVFPCEGTNDEACLDEALTSLITRGTDARQTPMRWTEQRDSFAQQMKPLMI